MPWHRSGRGRPGAARCAQNWSRTVDTTSPTSCSGRDDSELREDGLPEIRSYIKRASLRTSCRSDSTSILFSRTAH